MTLQPWQFVFLLFAGWVNRQQLEVIDYLRTENRVLREQLGGKRLRYTADQRRRLAAKGKRLGRKVLSEVCGVVSPDTILRWYRELIARKYDGSKARGPGRPRTAKEIRDLVVKMARENPRWGYTRLRGALENLGHTIGRNTVKRILAEHGIEPAPERGRRTSWSTFLKAHFGAIAGCDFFTAEAVTLTGLARFHVFFVIDLKTRRVEIGGIVRQPDGGWMKQVARNLVDGVDGFLGGFRYLIHDRDPLFTTEFRRILGSSGVDTIKLPARSPNLHAYAERFVLSIKSECLNRIVPLGEQHLRRAVREFVEHYNLERNHQGIGNQLIAPASLSANESRPVQCRERLGGLLRYYHRDAA